MKKNIGQVQPDKQEGLIQNNAPLLGKMSAVSYRSGVNLTMSCKGHRNTCWVNTQPIKGAARSGFTLMEVLIVVLIIAILAAVAVPQYQKAMLKSRFSALMPIAKAVADGNEVHYMEQGSYATSPTELDIAGQEEKYPDGTQIEMDNGDYSYVLAKRDKLPLRYIVYQKHSTNYPGEIHCEAETGNTQAEEICASLCAQEPLGPVLTSDYTTCVISGTGNGVAPGAGSANQGSSGDNTALLAAMGTCAGATSLGYDCNFTTNEEGKQQKIICVQSEGSVGKSCRTKTYNEDGSYVSETCVH